MALNPSKVMMTAWSFSSVDGFLGVGAGGGGGGFSSLSRPSEITNRNSLTIHLKVNNSIEIYGTLQNWLLYIFIYFVVIWGVHTTRSPNRKQESSHWLIFLIFCPVSPIIFYSCTEQWDKSCKSTNFIKERHFWIRSKLCQSAHLYMCYLSNTAQLRTCIYMSLACSRSAATDLDIETSIPSTHQCLKRKDGIRWLKMNTSFSFLIVTADCVGLKKAISVKNHINMLCSSTI